MKSSGLFKPAIFLAFCMIVIMVLLLRGSTTTQAQTTRLTAVGANQAFNDAPNNAVFASTFTVTEYGTTNLWYEINYNHRQAWVPATELTTL